MSKEDIDKAVRDAEKYADEDKKLKETVEIRNRAESLAFEADKTLNDVGDKVGEEDKKPVRDAIEKVNEALKGNDSEIIKAATEELEKAVYKISEKLYNAAGGAQGFDPNAGAQEGTDNGGADQNGYYNADFEDKT